MLHFSPFFIMALLIIFLFFTFVSNVSSLSSCPKCSNIQVPYPLSTDSNCGDSRYRVYCNNGALEFLSAQGFFYQISSINPSSNSLVISPPAIQETACFSSDLSFGGFRVDDTSPFNISNKNTVMLLNCSESILVSPLNCSANSFCRQFEEVREGNVCRGTLCCHFLKDSAMTSHRIRVRDGGCTAYTSVVDLKPGDSVKEWKYGIELQWQPPN